MLYKTNHYKQWYGGHTINDHIRGSLTASFASCSRKHALIMSPSYNNLVKTYLAYKKLLYVEFILYRYQFHRCREERGGCENHWQLLW
jgi:hypothetical protein